MLKSVYLMRASAGVLAGAGVALLFAPDDILPRLIAGFPARGAWLGQLLGVGWLAVAALNWLSKGARLGGIYGRPVVLANMVLYLMSATSLLMIVARPDTPVLIPVVASVFAAFAVLYGWLMIRGPFPHDER